jgi:hypothetical protein
LEDDDDDDDDDDGDDDDDDDDEDKDGKVEGTVLCFFETLTEVEPPMSTRSLPQVLASVFGA